MSRKANAQTHSGQAKSLIYAVFRWCYNELVHTDTPRSPGGSSKTRTTHMTLSQIERQADRLAPVALLIIGMLTAFSTAGLGI